MVVMVADATQQQENDLDQALLSAVAEGDSGKISNLLDRGANVDCQDPETKNRPLHLVCGGGSRSSALPVKIIVHLLLRHGAQVDSLGPENRTSLHICCMVEEEEGLAADIDVDIPACLIAHGANVNAKDSSESTPLHYAVLTATTPCTCKKILSSSPLKKTKKEGGLSKNNNLMLVQLLVNRGASLMVRNRNQLTPMGCAVVKDLRSYWNVITFLISRAKVPIIDEPIASPSDESDTIFARAVNQREVGMATWLVKSGASYKRLALETKIMFWGLCGIEEVAECMTSKRSSFGPDQQGRTPLHLSCYSGNLNATRGLAARANTNVNVQDAEGCTALHIAAVKSLDTVKWLIRNGHADPNIQNSKRWTPLHLAIQNPTDDATARWLIEFGVDLFAKNNNGHTPADVDNGYHCPEERKRYRLLLKSIQKALKAIYTGRMERLREAMEHVVPFGDFCASFARDKHGNTMLLSACAKQRSKEMIQFLMQQPGVDVCAVNHDGMNAIHLAAQSGRLDILQCLGQDKRADLFAIPDRFGRTPLHFTCEGGYVFVMDWLIQKVGVKGMFRTNHLVAETPFHVAGEMNQFGVIAHFIVQYAI